MAEILSIISTVSFVISGVALVLAVLFFVKFKIPSVIGDLTGRTAKKSIEQIRAINEKSGNKSFRPSRENENRGMLTGKIPDSSAKEKPQPKKSAKVAAAQQDNYLNGENVIQVSGNSGKSGFKERDTKKTTDSLYEKPSAKSAKSKPGSKPKPATQQETYLATENISQYAVEEETGRLDENEYANETEPLDSYLQREAPVNPAGGKILRIIDEVMLVHTNEVI